MSRDRGRRRFAPEQTTEGYPDDSGRTYDSYNNPGWYQSYGSFSNGAASGSSYNYWRDDGMIPTSHAGNPYHQGTYDEWNPYGERSYGRYERSHDERRYSERERGGTGRTEPRHPRQHHDTIHRSNRGPRRSNSPPNYSWRQHYSNYHSSSQTQPYLHPPAFRRTPPTDPITPATSPPPPDPPKRKRTPPAKPPPKPDAEYLALSQQPSDLIGDPSSSRKLLVLDLNGTLLIRSQRTVRSHNIGQFPKPRAVQPRPYMPAFRAYLFAPETQAWLDTMVWSSAQPHSVEDMVDKVFGSHKVDLKAVWTRQSLGLSEEEYHRKTVTTKDLTKPWKLLPLGISPADYNERSSASPPPKELEESSITHSALTTLLLDDSPHKASLQPYNHVCIPEYDSARRLHDLQSLNATKPTQPKASKRNKRRKIENVDKVDTKSQPPPNQVDPPSSPRPDSDLSVGSPPPASDPAGASGAPAEEPFDVTLLAVIGVLDAVKQQSNVAGWIHGGGLWATKEDPADSGVETAVEESRGNENSFASSVSPSDVKEVHQAKKRRWSSAEKKAAQAGHGKPFITKEKTALEDTPTVVQTGNDADTTSNPAITTSGEAQLQATMWFNDPSTLACWVARGRKALSELGIEALHGVTG
ncbi:hypothetical protein HYDPIDRAFT_108135 [Hydnomerulius pinastri MD-312]|nr:hypothetical protein HYDPIDRAFT_108135 [Hydnomerulius pinastri MD-312]